MLGALLWPGWSKEPPVPMSQDSGPQDSHHGAQQNLLIPCPSSPSQIPTSCCAWQNRLLQSSFWFGSGFVYSLRQNDATAPPWEGWGAGMGWLAPVNQQPWKITAGGLRDWKKSVLIGMFCLLRASVLDPHGQVTRAWTPWMLFPLHLLPLSSLGLVRGLEQPLVLWMDIVSLCVEVMDVGRFLSLVQAP